MDKYYIFMKGSQIVSNEDVENVAGLLGIDITEIDDTGIYAPVHYADDRLFREYLGEHIEDLNMDNHYTEYAYAGLHVLEWYWVGGTGYRINVIVITGDTQEDMMPAYTYTYSSLHQMGYVMNILGEPLYTHEGKDMYSMNVTQDETDEFVEDMDRLAQGPMGLLVI